MTNQIDWRKIVDEIEHEVGMGSGGWDLIDEKELILTIVSVAIKNELVSSAVWTNIDPNGKTRGLYQSKESASDDSLYREKQIHWKGVAK